MMAEMSTRSAGATGNVENLLIVSTFGYGLLSRLPYVVLGVYMVNQLDLTYFHVAILFAIYCTGQSAGHLLASYFVGLVFIIFGTLCGLLPWVVLALTNHRVAIGCSIFFLGFSEAESAVKRLIKMEGMVLGRTENQTKSILRCQMVLTNMGIFIAFVLGGYLYEKYNGIREVCFLGIGCATVNLCILVFVGTRRAYLRTLKIDLDDLMLAPGRESGCGDSVRRASETSTTSRGVSLMSKASNLKGNPMQKLIVLLTVVSISLVAPLATATHLGVGALYWQETWKRGTLFFGTLIGTGYMLGVLALFVRGQPVIFKSPLAFHFGKPINIMCTCFALGGSCLLATLPHEIISAIGTVLTCVWYVLLLEFQVEFIGTCVQDASQLVDILNFLKLISNAGCVAGSFLAFHYVTHDSYHIIAGCGLVAFAVVFFAIHVLVGTLPYQMLRAGYLTGKLTDRQGAVGTFDFALLLYTTLSAITSRIPFALFALYMVDRLDYRGWHAGAAMALFCFGQLCGTELTGSLVGIATMACSTACGILAWSSIVYVPENKIVFFIACFFLGCSENSGGLNTLLKVEGFIMSRSNSQVNSLFKCKLVMTCIGVVIAHTGGGFLYQISQGLHEIGLVCVGLSFVNLCLLAVCAFQRRVYRQTWITMEDVEGDVKEEVNDLNNRAHNLELQSQVRLSRTNLRLEWESSERQDSIMRVTVSSVDGIEVLYKTAGSEGTVKQALSVKEDDPIKSKSFIASTISLSFFAMVGVTAQFAIGALIWQERRWGAGPAFLGFWSSVGEICGVAMIIGGMFKSLARNPITFYFGAPANTIISCIGIAAGCGMASVNKQNIGILGVVFIHLCTVVAQHCQAETIKTCSFGATLGQRTRLSAVAKHLAQIFAIFAFVFLLNEIGGNECYWVAASTITIWIAGLIVLYFAVGAFPKQRVNNMFIRFPVRHKGELTMPETLLLFYSVLYAVVVHVPFIFFALHMVTQLDFSYLVTGITFCLYFFGRLVGAKITQQFVGVGTILFGTACGALAWILIIFMDTSKVAFVLSNFILGCSETESGIRTLLKIEGIISKRDQVEMQLVGRWQLIATRIGVCIAYLVGGIAYQEFGRVLEIGCFCIFCAVMNFLVLFFLYFQRRMYTIFYISLGDIEDEVIAASARKRKISMAAPGAPNRNRQTRISFWNVEALAVLEEGEEEAPIETDNLPLTTSTFLKTVCACFFFTAFGISSQLSSGAFYWHDKWNVGTSLVGLLMSVGEGLGIVLVLVSSQRVVFYNPLTFHFGKPVNLLTTVICLGLMNFVITFDNKILCAIGTVGIHVCHVCAHSFQSDLIALFTKGEDFGSWIVISTTVSRLANCCCVLGCLVCFGLLGPATPYWIVGGSCASFGIFLAFTFLNLGAFPFQRARSADDAFGISDMLAKDPLRLRNSLDIKKARAQGQKNQGDDTAPVRVKKLSLRGSFINQNGGEMLETRFFSKDSKESNGSDNSGFFSAGGSEPERNESVSVNLGPKAVGFHSGGGSEPERNESVSANLDPKAVDESDNFFTI